MLSNCEVSPGSARKAHPAPSGIVSRAVVNFPLTSFGLSSADAANVVDATGFHFVSPRTSVAGAKGLGTEDPIMRAMQIIEWGKPLEARDYPDPEPNGEEVLLRVEAAGVCHSDVHIWDGYFDLGGDRHISLESRGVPEGRGAAPPQPAHPRHPPSRRLQHTRYRPARPLPSPA